jgi:putative membrane protein (TIGR04086 family)
LCILFYKKFSYGQGGRNGTVVKDGENPGDLFTEELIVFVHIDRSPAGDPGISALQAASVGEGRECLYDPDLYRDILLCRIVAATFFAGFMTGKKIRNRRFLWGLLEGCAYFLVLAAVSFAVGQGKTGIDTSFFTTLVLCAGGGMLGGMLS